MKELTIEALTGNIPQVTEFVERQLEAANCPMKTQMQLNIAIDELLGNIARYAYHPGTGPVTVKLELTEEPRGVALTFIDRGVPYDPLGNPDPDTSLSAEEREIGGLGIYMVKKIMDEIEYRHENGQNILTVKKYFS